MRKAVRLKQLCSVKGRPGMLPVGPATIWRWVKSGKFPKPYKLSDGITVWDVQDVEAWCARKAAERETTNAY